MVIFCFFFVRSFFFVWPNRWPSPAQPRTTPRDDRGRIGSEWRRASKLHSQQGGIKSTIILTAMHCTALHCVLAESRLSERREKSSAHWSRSDPTDVGSTPRADRREGRAGSAATQAARGDRHCTALELEDTAPRRSVGEAGDQCSAPTGLTARHSRQTMKTTWTMENHAALSLSSTSANRWPYH